MYLLSAQEFRSAAQSWARRKHSPGDKKYVYVDLPDGARFRDHPELGANADRSDGALRLAFILYYDELEVVNPLGAFHGKHKLGLFYWTLVNVAQESRMAFKNMHLMTVALQSDIDYYGIEQVCTAITPTHCIFHHSRQRCS